MIVFIRSDGSKQRREEWQHFQLSPAFKEAEVIESSKNSAHQRIHGPLAGE